ncbi:MULTISPECIES: hypothetical protein [Bacillus]|uniref:Spore coat protein n=1 Tax=Bacillus glycinifermentans TaxID=1664069 RepID=A0AAJ3Z1A5_9BACI|nr:MULTISPECIES: hypothetical protein [Bacillus]KKB74382.1 hypothetical protein TH62_07450 [Bacillus sp. TH008]MDU0072676.1 hypothetical protein [Bacillus sp. IG6]MED8020470.1 hypothetical protein [Bacillus glycinifermentans]QAT66878.1 hypothetical protein EQZ20_19685 [Bacillus glycinifermentans]WKB76580.1 hypothetical protein QYM22_19810 [Bacillus glycinifermentans]
MQNQQGMAAPPPVISTKDHLYLQDMLNWNLLAMKKAHFMAEQCQDQSLKAELDRVGQMHHSHYNAILNHLRQGQNDNNPSGYMQ